MRKPNYLQVKLETGRLKEDFCIPYEDFETYLKEITLCCEVIQYNPTLSKFTKDFFLDLTTHLTSIDSRINNLLKL